MTVGPADAGPRPMPYFLAFWSNRTTATVVQCCHIRVRTHAGESETPQGLRHPRQCAAGEGPRRRADPQGSVGAAPPQRPQPSVRQPGAEGASPTPAQSLPPQAVIAPRPHERPDLPAPVHQRGGRSGRATERSEGAADGAERSEARESKAKRGYHQSRSQLHASATTREQNTIEASLHANNRANETQTK